MPRSRRIRAQNLTAMEKEKYFFSLYVKEGATGSQAIYSVVWSRHSYLIR